MKKLSVLLLSGVAFAVAGCGNQGGTSDQYNTDSGTTSNPSYDRRSVTNDYQDNALRPGRQDAGDSYNTNYPGLGTNNQNQPFGRERPNTTNYQNQTDRDRTNTYPEN